jgi:hypothetical protein
MAKRRSPRTVNVQDPEDVQPGAVGLTLATGRSGILDQASSDEADTTSAKSKREAIETFLATARKRWRQSAEYEAELRRDMLDDLRFYNAEQWPTNIKQDRVLDGRPCLTINRLPQFCRQVLNQARQQRPAITYNPVGDGADVDTAEVFQGIARSIERQSRAPQAYGQAGEHQVIFGRGWLRVRADYIAPDSFDQEILIESPEDAFTVYPDIASVLPDGRDALWGFLIARMPWHEYKVTYPNAERASLIDWTSIGDEAEDWVNETGVILAEYYYIELVPAELAEFLVQLPGEGPPLKLTTYSDFIKKADTDPGPNGEPPRITVLRKRPTVKRQLKWAVINGVDILEGNLDLTAGKDLPGSYIPLVPMQGEKLMVNGRRNLRGMVRDAKDPQRTYNFWVSAETEMIALAPRAPVIGAVGQFETTKEQWLVANRRNFPFLEYDPIDINGNLVPAPARNPFDPNVLPIIQATQQADTDLKSVIGMFDASQERSREQSGKAILARQAQGEQGTSHFLQHQAMAIEQIGRILLEWIPVYYDQPRIVRVIGLDDNERDVLVHAGNPQAAQQALDEAQQNPLYQAVGKVFDLSVGRYDVSVSVTPSFQSRREEAVSAMTSLIQSFPMAAPYALDVITKNMDWPGARELSERFKYLVPPEARDQNSPIPPQAQQQIGQMKQALQQAQQVIQQLQQKIDTKQVEQQGQAQIRQMELQSNERLAGMKQQMEMQKVQAKTQGEAQLKLLDARVQALAAAHQHLHERQMQVNDAALTPPELPPEPKAMAHQLRPVTETLNYKDAPPDVRRQIEQQAGLTPSSMSQEETAIMQAKAKPKPAPATPGRVKLPNAQKP